MLTQGGFFYALGQNFRRESDLRYVTTDIEIGGGFFRGGIGCLGCGSAE